MNRTEHLLKPLSIPGLSLTGNLFLAPMAGYTDAAFRTVCREWGAHFVCTEMLSAEAVRRENEKTLRLLKRGPGEHHLAVQIFAATPESAAAAVRRILPHRPSLIDLNCGCSVPKILRAGCGAALLQDPKLIGRIVRAMRRETDLPLSVKLRSGWDHAGINYLQTAAAAVEAGAAMVTLHPRTRAQRFSGSADWRQIAELKRFIPVPVVGSGDLLHPRDAERMLLETGCDAVMFARGAVGNPFIFARTAALLTTGRLPDSPTVSTRMHTALRQAELAADDKGEQRACVEMRKHFAAYIRGTPGARTLRGLLTDASSLEDYRTLAQRAEALAEAPESTV